MTAKCATSVRRGDEIPVTVYLNQLAYLTVETYFRVGDEVEIEVFFPRLGLLPEADCLGAAVGAYDCRKTGNRMYLLFYRSTDQVEVASNSTRR